MLWEIADHMTEVNISLYISYSVILDIHIFSLLENIEYIYSIFS